MVGMSLLVPVTMWLILTIGWRAAYWAMGLASAVVLLPLSLWVVRESPEAMGLTPDGLPDGPAAPGAAIQPERTAVSDALRTPSFCSSAARCSPAASR
jgi:hypothetical protein